MNLTSYLNVQNFHIKRLCSILQQHLLQPANKIHNENFILWGTNRELQCSNMAPQPQIKEIIRETHLFHWKSLKQKQKTNGPLKQKPMQRDVSHSIQTVSPSMETKGRELRLGRNKSEATRVTQLRVAGGQALIAQNLHHPLSLCHVMRGTPEGANGPQRRWMCHYYYGSFIIFDSRKLIYIMWSGCGGERKLKRGTRESANIWTVTTFKAYAIVRKRSALLARLYGALITSICFDRGSRLKKGYFVPGC